MDEDPRKLAVLKLKEELVTEEEQRDLDELGIAKNAREEKIRARDAKLKLRAKTPEEAAKDAQMLKLYREVVLGEKQPEGFIPLGSLVAPVNGNGNGNGNGSKPETVHEDEVAGVPGD